MYFPSHVNYTASQSAFVARSTLVYLYVRVNDMDLLICIFFFPVGAWRCSANLLPAVINLHTCTTRDLVSTRVSVLVLAWIILFWGEVVLFWAL